MITQPCDKRLRSWHAPPGFAAGVVRELALQDGLVAVYLLALLAVSLAGAGPRRSIAVVSVLADLVMFVVALAIARGQRAHPTVAALAYRVGLFGAVFGSFSQLQYILPTARATAVDAELFAFDEAVFRIEPAVAFDRFVTTGLTEWFSFFYFGYFFLLAIHIFPFLLAARSMERLHEISFGLIVLFCVGQLLYIVVPGFGPYQYLAGGFTHELSGPVWWHLVKSTVDAGEVTSRTDIFPSLHTAAPTYLALFAIRHRRARPFRIAWPALCFFASQIILSTMYLRWHYLIDVVAGLALAGAVHAVAGRVTRWETQRREALGLSPVWEGLVLVSAPFVRSRSRHTA